MKGLELSRGFYEEYGAPMLHEQFPEWENRIAAALCGSGSECWGYDDAVSQDHDFEPGFCLFLPGEDEIDRRTAFQLERAYAKLPKEYMGFRRGGLSPVGGSRRGVLRMADFFTEKTGRPDGALTLEDWMTLPSWALAEAVNGEVFRDDSGEFTAVRERLRNMPEDVRRKKLAGQLLLMGQSGQYNYRRCVLHGETGAAQLAAVTFVRSAMEAAFLLSRRYMPYYKWSFRALRELPGFGDAAETLEYLLTSGNDEWTAEQKYTAIEELAARYIDILAEQGLTKANCGDLEKHAYSVNDGVEDPGLRNRSVLAAV